MMKWEVLTRSHGTWRGNNHVIKLALEVTALARDLEIFVVR